MDSEDYCAYNHTRECSLGLEIVCGDFAPASLDEWMATLKAGGCAGLWMQPFRGLPKSAESVPMDLIYLDQDHRILDLVEFFPTCRIPASRPLAASVLALPLHSIFSSNSKPGDQLIVCKPAEFEGLLAMENSLDNFRPFYESEDESVARPSEHRPEFAPEPPFPSETPRFPYGGQPLQGASPEMPLHETLLVEPVGKVAPAPLGWLKRLLSKNPPDGRKARRTTSPGLDAYFFTGGTPQAHGIRDLSSTGLFLVTTERWYPGTLVRLTLTRTGGREFGQGRSISIQARAVRWGNDGVGLQFVPQDAKNARPAGNLPLEGADKKQLEEFVARLTGVTR